MSSFPYKNPISSEQLNGVQSVQRSEVFGTNFSVLSVGGYMEVFNLSDLVYTINGLGPIEYSGNTIPIDFLKGTGDPWSPDVLTLNSDNISSGRRRLGMLAYVYENDQTYQFRIDNYETLWTAATASTGTVVISDFGTTVYNSSVPGQNFINAWTASTIEDVSGATHSTAVWKKFSSGSNSGATGNYLPLSGGTVYGNTTFTSGLTVNYVDFDTTPNVPSPTGGTVYFDSNENALSYKPITPSNDVTVNLGQESLIRIYNDLGFQINNGQALHITGSTSGSPSVSLAIGTGGDEVQFQISGIATHDIPNSSFGFMTYFGIVRDINLTGFTVGEQIYLSQTVPGGFSSYSGLSFTGRTCEVGHVLDNSALGKIQVSILNEIEGSIITTQENNILAANNSSTGVFQFSGLSITTPSGTTFNVGAVEGWIIDNTTSPTNPTIQLIIYSGATGITATNVTSATETYILLTSGSTITQQTTFPTPQQRRQNLYLGKFGHGNRQFLINAFNEPDSALSPVSQLRDMFTAVKLINDGVIASANGANLNMNTSAGVLYGLGIGYVTNKLNPNTLTVGGQSPATFQYRTQTGGTASNVTLIEPGFYDNNGVRTAIIGVKATNQRIYLLQNGQIRVQYGQIQYNQLAAAVAALQNEVFVTFPNFRDNGILIGILSVLSSASALDDTSKAQFFSVSKFGELIGAAGGTSTTTLQQAYNNSSEPEILINSTLDGLSIRNGTGNADNVTSLLQGQNTAGTTTSFISADGAFSGTSISATTATARIITGGSGSTNSGTYSFIGGGVGNTASGSYSFVGGGNSNTSSGYYGTIVGGIGNTVSAKYSSSILGGVGNIVAENQSVIGGGVTNVIGSTSSTYSIYNTNSTYNRVVILGDVTSSYSLCDTVQFFNCVDNKLIKANITNSTYSGGYTCLDLDNTTGSNIYGGAIINSTTIAPNGTQNYSGIVSGLGNNLTQSAYYSFIGGGYLNTVTSPNSAINGGSCNNISGKGNSFIGGGNSNNITNSNSTIGGGRLNTSSGMYSTVSGGYKNTSSCNNSTVSGGYGNTSSSYGSTVGGGYQNTSSCRYSTIGGGRENTASSNYAGVLTGLRNFATGDSSFILGGRCNLSSGSYSTVSGGYCNISNNQYSSIMGGVRNVSSGKYSTIINGENNSGLTTNSFIGGGYSGLTLSSYSFIGNGKFNTISGKATYGAILGGCGNTVSGVYSGAFGCGLVASVNCTFYSNNFCGCGNISSSNLTNGCTVCVGVGGTLTNGLPYSALTGSTIMVLGAGTCSTVRCGVGNTATLIGSASIAGSANTVTACYSTIAGGSVNSISERFSFIGGGSNNFAYGTNSTIINGGNNSGSTFYSFIGTGGSNLSSGNTSSILNGNSNIAGGGCSTVLNGGSNFALGCSSFIGGGTLNRTTTNASFSSVVNGQSNCSDACFTSIVGGVSNCITASNCYSSIVGGKSNVICSTSNCSFIGGGSLNIAAGQSSGVAAGSSNTALCSCSFVGAGQFNSSCSVFSFVGGGQCNIITGTTSAIVGGFCNRAQGIYSFVGTGTGNTVTGAYSSAFGCGLNASASCTLYSNNIFACGSLNVRGLSVLSATTGTSLTVISSGNSTSAPVFSVQGSQGELFSVTDSLTGSLFSVSDISGLPIMEVFSDSTIILGDYQAPSLYTTKRVSSITATTGTTIYSFPTSAYTSSFADYYVSGSTGLRAGNIMAIWSGSSVNFTETSTNDIGVTTPLTFGYIMSGSSAVLQASASTGTWIVESILRGL